MNSFSIKHRIDVAAGRAPADLLLKNARVVSVFADCIYDTSVAISDGVIVGFGNYRARKTLDLNGRYLSAGLIDSHIHIESTLLSPAEFARVVVPRGTTAVVADPHEIANVLGERGIKWMIQASRGLPIDINVVLPSCVPASKFEGSAEKLDAAKLNKLVGLDGVVGIGEVMDFRGVIEGNEDLLRKIRLIPGMRVDGHAPGLTGKDLYAYIAAGIHSDHESTTAKEAMEKLLAGLHIMIREGSNEKNLQDLAKIVTPANSHRCFFCSDDRSPMDLVKHGHMDHTLRLAVKSGIPPITALQMATNNAPYYFRLKHRQGAVAIGYCADLVVFDDLKNFNARMVFKGGKLVAKDGELVVPCSSISAPKMQNSVKIAPVAAKDFSIKARTGRLRVIQLISDQITTRQDILSPKVLRGEAVADPARDIVKLAVVERHFASGRISLGFLKGLGLKRGAIASTVCHDAHNLIVAGVCDSDMASACHALKDCGGGFVAVLDGKVVSLLPLPIAGLMSDKHASIVAENYSRVEAAARKLGSKVKNPFLAISFLALSVVPDLRLTDKGLVDVNQGKLIGLWG